MLKFVIDKVVRGEDLTREEMMEAMNIVMEGRATPTQIGGFLTSLRMKGETEEEIVASAKVMRDKALRVNINSDYAIDTCGTGGDEANTFNISTVVAIVAAAAGVTVVKHGNRSVSSKCGSADVLEALGINIDMKPEQVTQCVDKLGLGFMFAPNFHEAMKHVVTSRRELGVRTIFNVLGPLTNPARVKGQVFGVFDESLTEILAGVLKQLGVETAMVVHGLDGLDEITITALTKVSELNQGRVTTYYINPLEFGFPLANIDEIMGGSSKENAQIILDILKGEKGAKKNIVLLNAGAAIYVGKKAKSLMEGIEKAREVIDKGLALEKLRSFTVMSQEMKI